MSTELPLIGDYSAPTNELSGARVGVVTFPGTLDDRDAARAVRASGAEAVLLSITPTTFLNLAHAAQGQAYSPLWAGPGLSNGLNLIAEFGCPSIAGARFLSPFPQIDVIDRFDADYKVAAEKCESLSGDAKGACVSQAKSRYGK